MKGIYLTEEAKQQLEAKIAELELVNKIEIENKWEVKAGVTFGCILMLNEILSSATILPVEESLNDIPISVLMGKQNLSEYHPNGVIIQLKNKDANN
jgi:hypothetical protein